MHPHCSRRPGRLLAGLLFLALLGGGAGCGGGSSGRSSLDVNTAAGTVTGTSRVVVVGSSLVYFASEALGGTGSLNSDVDTLDEVAMVVRLDNLVERNTGAAAMDAAIVQDEIYLRVDEAADGVDWSGMNGPTEEVLLHYSLGTDALTYVDTLAPGTGAVGFVALDTRLYYASATATPMGDETALAYLDFTDPTTPVLVENVMGGGTLAPILLGESEDLLFLALDENVEGVPLNGDGDTMDMHVLALLDGTDATARVVNVGLALRDASSPIDAAVTDFGDWLVGFLVDETNQGVNLNDPDDYMNPIVPGSCAPDGDTLDEVLHYVEFADFVAGMATPVATGLAGTDRVVVVDGHLATLSSEADAGCNLNEDMDSMDTVVRWVSVGTPVAPAVDPAAIHAVATAIPGGSMGLVSLTDRFVSVVDEAADGMDHDGKPADHDLLAWLDPEDGLATTWTFAHQDPVVPSFGTGVFADLDGDGIGDPSPLTSEPYAGTSWLGPDEYLDRVGAVFLEEVPGTNPMVGSLNNNLDCGLFAKDMDMVDGLPVWLDFEQGPVLDFDGVGYAVDKANAGVRVSGAWAFFRACEASDGLDHNADGVLDDVVLMRNGVASCTPAVMGDASTVPGPLLFTDGVAGGAFFSDETMAGEDLNGDGDADDLVVSHFVF
jgi:hypothetical protein